MKSFLVKILLLLWLEFVAGRVLSGEEKAALEQLSDRLQTTFLNHSHAAVFEESVRGLASRLRVRSESAEAALLSSTSRLRQLFDDRKKALLKIVRAAEGAAGLYDRKLEDPGGTSVEDDSPCSSIQSIMKIRDVHLYNPLTDGNRSGIHINLESYTCDPSVVRDFEWSGSENIEKAFEENKQKWPELGYQYIGTYTGLTRMYPSRPWIIDPSSITVDLFDPRFRPWFTQSESVPKDVVFLIDFSGSMKGPTMHLAKVTVMYIMSTLGPNDYFYGIWFHEKFAPVLNCSGSNKTFLPATTTNKKIFYEKLATIEEWGEADLEKPLKFTLNKLREHVRRDLPVSPRSGGHKIVMFFTDGIDKWPDEVVHDEVETKQGEPVRIYGYAVGFGTGQMPRVQTLTCLTNSTYAIVDSISDVKAQGRAHLNHLSKQRGRRLKEKAHKTKQRPISWSSLYHDTQGLGPVVSLSAPIPVDPKEIWRDHTMAGIAAVDIHISEITTKLPSGEQIYGFLVDNNAMAIFHPKLLIPKTEVHSVRRSACYDAASVKSKAGAGLKVQYGFSDERVFRLVGLIDSIPTIDMIDLEENTTALGELRNKVIDRTCTDESIQDGPREYYCSEVKGTPFTVIIVNHHEQQTLTVASSEDTETPTLEHDMVATVVTNRPLCSWLIDQIPITERATHLLSHPDCLDEPQRETLRASIATLGDWIDSWPESKWNITCSAMPFPEGISSAYYVGSFAHTRYKVASYYPECAQASMKTVIQRLDKLAYTKKNTTDLEFTYNFLNEHERDREKEVLVTKSFTDKYGNRIATSGVVWRLNFLEKVFTEWTDPNSTLWRNFTKKEIFLVTADGWVLATNNARRKSYMDEYHLINHDKQLFYSLINQKLVEESHHLDVQGECSAKRAAPWASRSPNQKTPFKALINTIATLISSTFWIDLFAYLTHPVSGQPTLTREGKCQFQKIKPFERCVVGITSYRLLFNENTQIDLFGGGCARYLSVRKVPGTNLFVLIADSPCPASFNKNKLAKPPTKMFKRLSDCAVVTSRYRRKPPDFDTEETLDVLGDGDCSSVVAATVPAIKTNQF
ncbi:unnamed protein product, partial [Mesorhabditis belari]|uniref:VWFA domain-containing protein n=1 Tax=Mesorhabditis belari TaxID=2138241 RepID=A0AAF3J7S5_9BILA